MNVVRYREEYERTFLGRAFLKSDISVEEIARKTEVSKPVIRNYLRRKDTQKDFYVGIIAALAEMLNVDVKEAVYDYI